MLVAAEEAQRRMKRNRLFMFIALICILVVISALYVSMKNIAAERAAQNKHSFIQYVTTNHVGKLIEIDSGTGLDPMSYVLQLDHTVRDADKLALVRDLMQHYVQYDRGTTLTIVYVRPGTTEQTPIAEAHYNRIDRNVTLTIHKDSGDSQTTTESVDW